MFCGSSSSRRVGLGTCYRVVLLPDGVGLDIDQHVFAVILPSVGPTNDLLVISVNQENFDTFR